MLRVLARCAGRRALGGLCRSSRGLAATAATPAIPDLRKRALEGHVQSAAELGKHYLDRDEHEEAQHWLELAAEQDWTESQYLLGVHLHTKAVAEKEAAENSDQQPQQQKREGQARAGMDEARAQVLREIEAAKQEARRKRKARLQEQKARQQQQRSQATPSPSSTSSDTEKEAAAAAAAAAAAEVQDAAEGTSWLRSAARRGHAPAMVYLGNVLLARTRAGGPLAHGQEALLWYQKAAALPVPAAAAAATTATAAAATTATAATAAAVDVASPSHSLSLSLSAAAAAAAQTSATADALFNLGTLCFSGQPGLVLPDLPRSLAYFEQAAALGDAGSLFWLGHCYVSGEGGAGAADRPRGLELLRRAAALGHPAAHHHLALAAREDGDWAAFRGHLQAATAPPTPDADALFLAADLALHGGPAGSGLGRDEAGAVRLLRRAAAAGQVEALVSLGALCYDPSRLSDPLAVAALGLDEDEDSSTSSSTNSADPSQAQSQQQRQRQPQPLSQAQLANGKRRALALYSEAAEAGSAAAWRNLAAMHALGVGVSQSEETARHILRLVAQQEAEEAKAQAEAEAEAKGKGKGGCEAGCKEEGHGHG